MAYYVICDDDSKHEGMTKEQIYAAIAQAAESGLVFDADAAFITKIKEENAGGFVKFWAGTQAQWNAIEEKDTNCFPIFTDIDEYRTIAEAVVAAVSHISNKSNPHNITIGQIGAAPSGYGLGTVAKYVPLNAQLGDCLETGFYSWNTDNAAEDKPFPAGEMISIKRSELYGTQIAFRADYDRTTIQIRKMTSGVWGEWEWVNPPMAYGVEYRTTERHNGKSVYIKRVDCGAMPATDDEGYGYKSIQEVCPENAKVISFDIYTRNEEHTSLTRFPYYHDGILALEAKIIRGNILIYAYRDRSDLYGFAVVKYVKD